MAFHTCIPTNELAPPATAKCDGNDRGKDRSR